MIWNHLYEMLPDKRRVGMGWEPAMPLILAAWWEAPALAKMLRLTEHIERAEKHGCLPEISAYLRGLPEITWGIDRRFLCRKTDARRIRSVHLIHCVHSAH